MKSPVRKLYVTFAALSAVSFVLAYLLVRPGARLDPVRGAPRFELDEPAPGLVGSP
jgi:hypothetical protein